MIALALAACGPKADAPREPLGNRKLVAAPDRDACLAAIADEWPADPVDGVDVLQPDPTKPIVACHALRDVDGMRESRLYTLVRNDTGWHAGEIVDWSTELEEHDDGSKSGESSVELFAIAPGESAIQWTTLERAEGPEWGALHTDVSLWRLGDDGTLRSVFEMESDSAGGEADDLWERTLSAADTTTEGFYDLVVEIVHKTAEWALGDSEYNEESWQETYRWSDGAYLLSGPTSP